MPEEFALQQAGGNGGAVELDEGAVFAPAQAVKARAINSLPVPVSPRIRTVASQGATVAAWSSTLLERRAVADDLSEMSFGTKLAFQIFLLFGEAVLEDFNLSRGAMIFQGNRELGGDLVQKANILRMKRILAGAAEDENSQRPVGTEKRKAAQAIEVPPRESSS